MRSASGSMTMTVNCRECAMRAKDTANGKPRSAARDATAGRKPTCPRCASDAVVADAGARWTSGAPAGWQVSNVCDARGATDIDFVWVDFPMLLTLASVPPDDGLVSGTHSTPDDPVSRAYRVTWIMDMEADSPLDVAASRFVTMSRKSVVDVLRERIGDAYSWLPKANRLGSRSATSTII